MSARCVRSSPQRAGAPARILSTEFYIAFAPWASAHSYEFWIYPKRHQTSILKLSQKELMDLSLLLRSTLGGMSKVLDDCGFNLVIHSSSEKKTTKQIHWHVEVYPRVSKWAGLELGAGIFVNEVSPESAAELLGAARQEGARPDGRSHLAFFSVSMSPMPKGSTPLRIPV